MRFRSAVAAQQSGYIANNYTRSGFGPDGYQWPEGGWLELAANMGLNHGNSEDSCP